MLWPIYAKQEKPAELLYVRALYSAEWASPTLADFSSLGAQLKLKVDLTPNEAGGSSSLLSLNHSRSPTCRDWCFLIFCQSPLCNIMFLSRLKIIYKSNLLKEKKWWKNLSWDPSIISSLFLECAVQGLILSAKWIGSISRPYEALATACLCDCAGVTRCGVNTEMRLILPRDL